MKTPDIAAARRIESALQRGGQARAGLAPRALTPIAIAAIRDGASVQPNLRIEAL